MINKRLVIGIIIVVVGFVLFLYLSKLLGMCIILAFVVVNSLPSIYTILGNGARRKGQIEKAIKFYKKASNNIFASCRLKIGYAYFMVKNGYVDEAEEVLNKILNQKTSRDNEIRIASTYGLVLWKKGKIDDAVKMASEIKEKYRNSSIYETLGYFLILKGDYSKGLEINKEAYEFNNSDIGIMDNLALNYYLIGDYDKAYELYEKVVAMNPQFVTTYYYYALLLVKYKKYEEALQYLDTALHCEFSFITIVSKAEIERKISEVKELMGA